MRPLAVRVTWRPGGPVCRGPKWTDHLRFGHTTAPGSPGLRGGEAPCGRRHGDKCGAMSGHDDSPRGLRDPGPSTGPQTSRPLCPPTVHSPQSTILSAQSDHMMLRGPGVAEKSGHEHKDKQAGKKTPGPAHTVLAPQPSSRSVCGKLEKDAEIARLIPIGCDCFCGLVAGPVTDLRPARATLQSVPEDGDVLIPTVAIQRTRPLASGVCSIHRSSRATTPATTADGVTKILALGQGGLGGCPAICSAGLAAGHGCPAPRRAGVH